MSEEYHQTRYWYETDPMAQLEGLMEHGVPEVVRINAFKVEAIHTLSKGQMVMLDIHHLFVNVLTGAETYRRAEEEEALHKLPMFTLYALAERYNERRRQILSALLSDTGATGKELPEQMASKIILQELERIRTTLLNHLGFSGHFIGPEEQ